MPIPHPTLPLAALGLLLAQHATAADPQRIVGAGSLSLDPPAASAPGVNNLSVVVDPLPVNVGLTVDVDADEDNIQLAGDVAVELRMDLTDPANPVVTGVRFTGGAFTASDVALAFYKRVFLLGTVVDIDLTGTGLGGVIGHPDAPFAPALANAFSTASQNILMNQGVLAGNGFMYGSAEPIDFVIDLAQTPLEFSAPYDASIAITHVASDRITHTYDVTISIPVDLDETTVVSEGPPLVEARITAGGIIRASGTVTAHILPDVRLTSINPDEVELELNGQGVGETVMIQYSEDLVVWHDLGEVTLSQATEFIADQSENRNGRRYYRVALP